MCSGPGGEVAVLLRQMGETGGHGEWGDGARKQPADRIAARENMARPCRFSRRSPPAAGRGTSATGPEPAPPMRLAHFFGNPSCATLARGWRGGTMGGRVGLVFGIWAASGVAFGGGPLGYRSSPLHVEGQKVSAPPLHRS